MLGARIACAGAVVGALSVALTGCGVPQVNFDPVAVRLSTSGDPEMLYTSCTPKAVKVAEIVAIEAEWGDHTPRLWKIEFPTGSTLKSFVVGTLPEGAVERIHWQRPDEGKSLSARMVLEGGIGVYEYFTMRDLKPGQVVFRDRSISEEEFRRASACG